MPALGAVLVPALVVPGLVPVPALELELLLVAVAELDFELDVAGESGGLPATVEVGTVNGGAPAVSVVPVPPPPQAARPTAGPTRARTTAAERLSL